MKVQVRAEIVSLGEGDSLDHDGARRLSPDAWDALLEAGEVTLVDLRNSYEIDAGTFPGAIDPGTTGFREFPAWAEASLPTRMLRSRCSAPEEFAVPRPPPGCEGRGGRTCASSTAESFVIWKTCRRKESLGR